MTGWLDYALLYAVLAEAIIIAALLLTLARASKPRVRNLGEFNLSNFAQRRDARGRFVSTKNRTTG